MLSSLGGWLRDRQLLIATVSSVGLAACSGSSDGDGGPAELELPGVPQNIVVSEEDARLIFSFDEPATGGPAYRYTVTCEPQDEELDTVSRYSGVSPVTLSGMTNEMEYSCTLVASNTSGEGPETVLLATPTSGFYDTDCSSQTTTGDRLTCLGSNFLSGLTTTQRSNTLLELSETNAVQVWSDLRAGAYARVGMSFAAMTEDQADDALLLIQEALSEAGSDTLIGIFAADDFLSETLNGYGSDLYYFSFLGTPSTSEPWILAFTGHHYSALISVDGDYVSMTPHFVASEPLTFTLEDVDFAPMESRHTALTDMLASLTADQLNTANLGETFDDILGGPRDDYPYPDPKEGVSVGDLSAAQRELVADAIAAFSNDQTDMELTAVYTTEEALDETYIAWSIDEELTEEGGYVRIDGPQVWIELAVVDGEATSDAHYHTIWRDRALDYGGNFDLSDE